MTSRNQDVLPINNRLCVFRQALTTIIDLADRKVVGWALSEDMITENTIMKAWLAARRDRD